MILDNPIVTGSLNVQNAVTASNISIAATASAAYFTGSFVGDGTQLSGVTSYTDSDTLEYINSLGVLSGSAQIASDISGAFASVSESIAQDIANISTDFDDITNKPTLISSSAQIASDISGSFTDLSSSLEGRVTAQESFSSSLSTTELILSGSFSGSFIGDGSQLSGVTSYTDADTLAFINSKAVLSGSIAELTAVTASFLNTGSVTIPHSFNSKNVSVAVYDDSDILIIPQEIALISNNAVKITFGGSTSGFAVVAKGGHIVSGSVPVPQLSTVTDSFTSATTHTVTHNFNTKEVIVSVYEGDTYIIPDTITTDDLNNVTVTFPEAVTGRVVVVKAGHIVSGSIPFDNITLSPFVQSNTAVTSSKHIVPSQDQTYDLGSPTLRFRDLYLSSASIFLGNTVISEDNVVTTASLASVLPANVVSSSAQIASDISGSFTSVSASIASDLVSNYLKNTSDTLDGDLTVTGKITAQEFHTEFVSASIIYESGSTQFGNSGDDSHTFRGQLFVGAGDSENILTSKNYSALDQPEQLKIKHSSGSDVIQSLRGNLFLSSSAGAVVLQKDGGAVGIATSNPATPLQVHGNQVGSFDGISVSNFKTFGAGTGQNYSAINLSVTELSELNALNRVFGSLEAGTWNEQSSNPGIFNFKVRSGGNPVTALTLFGGYDDNPKVGIGMSSPNWKLYVSSSNSLTSFFESSDTATIVGINNSNVSGDPQLKFYLDGIGKYTLGVDNSDGDKFKIATTDLDTNPRLVIDSGGQVGISTTVPRSLLHVARRGNVNGGTLLIGDGESATNKWSFLAGAHRDQATGSGNGVGSAGIALIGSYADNTDNTVYIGGGPYEINAATKIIFHTHTSNLSTLGGSPRMIIDSNGNVGIGATNPQSRLQVDGGNFRFNYGNADAAYYMWINKKGNQDGGLLLTRDNSTLDWQIVNNTTSGDLGFYAYGAAAQVLRIKRADGNVGVGTTNPQQKLHIAGSYGVAATSGTTQNGLLRLHASTGIGYGETLDMGVHVGVTGPPSHGWLQTTNNSDLSIEYNLALNPNGGNVGIGTTTPTQRLEVAGNIKANSVDGKVFTDTFSYAVGATFLDTITTNSSCIYEYTIVLNPNTGGSSAYIDHYYGKVGVGAGWNGSNVTMYIWLQQDQSSPRSLYPSGGGDIGITANMLSGGSVHTSLVNGTTYTIRFQGFPFNSLGTIYMRRLA